MTVADQAQASARLRTAFSHLESDCSIAAFLTPEQEKALAEYRAAHGMTPRTEGTWDMQELPDDVSQQDKAMILKFKEQLDQEGVLKDEHDRAYVTDLRLLQYLRARDFHLDKSHAMLLATLAWRRETKPWEVENKNSRTDKTVSDARIVGYDKQGRLVVYSSFANTTQRTPKDVITNAVATMEKASHCVNAGTAGSLVWVNNFGARHKNGFGWRDCNPAFFFSGIHVFQNNYPECLSTMIICDPPNIFFSVWNVVKPMLNIKTQQKAAFVDSRQVAKMRALFIETFGDELGEWMVAQVQKDSP